MIRNLDIQHRITGALGYKATGIKQQSAHKLLHNMGTFHIEHIESYVRNKGTLHVTAFTTATSWTHTGLDLAAITTL